ncbi:MAG: single-stranded-DNA-specific exonuclease RecJ [Pirellulales bacterium]
MAKRWRIRAHDPDRIAALAGAAGIPPVVAQLLISRGIHHPTLARDFLYPRLTSLREPSELPGATAAARRIMEAVRDKRRMVVYGDYDVDGMTGTAILWRCLTLLGAEVGYYVPHRIEEGYGLNQDALASLAAQGTALVITVDCGITSVDEASAARQLGVELIITDHHEPEGNLPDASAVVHPRLPGHAYPFGDLSGAGVAFKLAWALCQEASQAQKVSPRMKDFLLEAVGLAALGTVADVVPLVDENRVLVRYGLNSLKERPPLGLATLLKVTKLDRKPKLDGDDIAFTLAPRLNAAGRLGQAQLAVELLITNSPERAVALAEYIDQLNGQRQTLERSIYLAANKQAMHEFDPENDAALVLADRGWHVGVIGIVAGRLAEKYHRPVVLLSLDELGVKPAVGSARSVPGFNLHQALTACGRHLVSHGGHAAAAGLKMHGAMLDGFRADFLEHVAGEIPLEDRVAELWIDAEAPLSAFTLKSVEQIEQMAPFGQGNARPVLSTTDVALAEPPRKIGDGRHLSLRLTQHGVNMRAVAFGGGDWADELAKVEGSLAVAFRPIINDFRGRRTVELQVADWRAAK